MKINGHVAVAVAVIALASGCQELTATPMAVLTLMPAADSTAIPTTMYDQEYRHVVMKFVRSDGTRIATNYASWSSSDTSIIEVAQGGDCSLLVDPFAPTMERIDAQSHACLIARKPGFITITVKVDQPGFAADSARFGIRVNEQWIDVATLTLATCAVNVHRDAFCWGYGPLLGTGSGNDVSRPRALFNPQLLKFDRLYGGPNSACGGIAGAKVVACWGYNFYGAGGFGKEGVITVAPTVVNVAGFERMALGRFFSCGVLAQPGAEATCWGLDSAFSMGRDSAIYGEPCSRTTIDADLQPALGRRCVYPVNYEQPAPFTSVQDVAVAEAHGCLIGTVTLLGTKYGRPHAICWGDNTMGELGDSGKVLPRGIAEVGLPEAATATSTIVAGGNHTCVRLGAANVDGSVYCWGENGSGESGSQGSNPACANGPLALCFTRAPQRIGRQFVQVVAGSDFTCGRTAAGDAYCWGNNSLGQLGIGDSSIAKSSTPLLVQMDSARKFIQLSASAFHACGVTVQRRPSGTTNADGALFCWGWNTNGQLGDGTSGLRFDVKPVRVLEPLAPLSPLANRTFLTSPTSAEGTRLRHSRSSLTP